MTDWLEAPDLPGRLGQVVRWAHTDTGLSRLRDGVWALVLVSLLSFLVQGANRPADPYLTNQYLPGTAPGATTGHGG